MSSQGLTVTATSMYYAILYDTLRFPRSPFFLSAITSFVFVMACLSMFPLDTAVP
jgi:hypothetical protein